MRKKFGRIFGPMCILISLCSVIMTPSVYASPTRIYLDPANYIFSTTSVSLGHKFNVTVRVADVTDLAAWQVAINYKDTIINVTRWYEPKEDPFYVFYGRTTLPVPAPPPVAYSHTDPDQGQVIVSCALFPAPSPGGGFSGSGTLCIVEFIITAVPPPGETYSCTLHIDKPETYLLNSMGAEIPGVVKENGYYELSAPAAPYDVTIKAYCYTEGTEVSVSIKKDGMPTGYNTPHTFTGLTGSHTFTVPTSDPSGHPFANWSTSEPSTTITVSSGGIFTAYYEAAPIPVGTRLYVDPPEIIDPTMLPSSTFHINITIDDVGNMQICEFNLTYDTNILGWIGVNILRVQGQMPRASLAADDDAGYIWMKLNYTIPVTTLDPIPLVKIEFHVEALGATPLDLHDTELLDPQGNPIEHTAEDGFFMTLIRDVAITNVVPSRDWTYAGWPVNIMITAKNLGNISETFDVKAYYDGNLIGTSHVDNLAPNAEINKTLTWNTSGVLAGNYTITGEATTVPYEFNTANNVYVDGKVQVLTVIRDVAITSVIPARNWVYHGKSIGINVTAKNLGYVSETFDVKAYYDSNLIGAVHIVDLTPSAEITLTFTWDTSLATPCHNYTIKGEATMVPYEFNTTNNVYVDGTVKIYFMGDINKDGNVDMMDIFIVIQAFGTYIGHPRYNPEADLDENGVVDMRDIYIVIKNFGKSCA